jgi:hypothetical protein
VNLTHIRTENGTPTLITARAALDEIETVMAADDDDTEMYGSGSTYNITYPDGRQVNIRPATPEQVAELTTVGEPHIRIAGDGPAQAITFLDAITEINAALGGSLRNAVHDVEVRGTNATIPYIDGVTVNIRPATPAELDTIARESADSTPTPVAPEVTAHGRPAHIVTVNGKRYVVDSDVSPAKTYTLSNGTERTWPGGVDYWTERNGKCFGPVRVALGNSRPGTVGAAIWAAANR